jgi:hypothetical protein
MGEKKKNAVQPSQEERSLVAVADGVKQKAVPHRPFNNLLAGACTSLYKPKKPTSPQDRKLCPKSHK